MKAQIKNLKGEKLKEENLPKEIFEIKIKPDLLSQVVSIQIANRRRKTASVKERDEVRGGGRKPWRQKGTGRARHGSTRSPIWKGGGVTFGPNKERNFKKTLPKKIKRKALLGVLSLKAKDKEIILLDKLSLEKPKTKLMKKALDKIIPENSSALIITSKKEDDIYKASRNIPGISVKEAREINVLDVLSFKYLLIEKESIKVIKDTFLK